MTSKTLDLEFPINLLKEVFHKVNIFGSLPPLIFGCVAFVHSMQKTGLNWILENLKCVFLGNSPTQNEYKCFHPTTRKIFVTMDVRFFESLSYYTRTCFQGEESEVEKLPFLNQDRQAVMFPSLLEFIQDEHNTEDQCVSNRHEPRENNQPGGEQNHEGQLSEPQERNNEVVRTSLVYSKKKRDNMPTIVPSSPSLSQFLTP